jgi:hypothetical protein
MPQKVLLAIRKSDGKVMTRPQSGSYAPVGKRLAQAVKQHGGSPDDYFEYLVEGDADALAVMKAKELKWDRHNDRLRVVPYSGPEQNQMERERRRANIEAEMVREQSGLDAAEKLGLDTTERRAKLDRLKAQHEEIKEKLRGR